jgi:hypothetical protein
MYFWLSFADPHKPKGSQFLGALIIDTSNYIGPFKKPLHPKDNEFAKAVTYSQVLNLNPGGAIRGFPIDNKYLVHEEIKALVDSYKDRLLTREECIKLDELILTTYERSGTVTNV